MRKFTTFPRLTFTRFACCLWIILSNDKPINYGCWMCIQLEPVKYCAAEKDLLDDPIQNPIKFYLFVVRTRTKMCLVIVSLNFCMFSICDSDRQLRKQDKLAIAMNTKFGFASESTSVIARHKKKQSRIEIIDHLSSLEDYQQSISSTQPRRI